MTEVTCRHESTLSSMDILMFTPMACLNRNCLPADITSALCCLLFILQRNSWPRISFDVPFDLHYYLLPITLLVSCNKFFFLKSMIESCCPIYGCHFVYFSLLTRWTLQCPGFSVLWSFLLQWLFLVLHFNNLLLWLPLWWSCHHLWYLFL